MPRGGDRHRSPGFFNRERHASAILNLVAEGLVSGDGEASFRFADRLCRLSRPEARQLLARCLSLDLLGKSKQGLADLDGALAADSSDLLVLRRAIGRDVETQTRVRAAQAIVSDVYALEADVGRALACLGECGQDVLVGAGRSGRSIAGWVAWSGNDPPAVRWLGDCDEGHLGLENLQRAAPGLRRASFAFDRDPDQAVTIEARSSGGRAAEVQVYAELPPLRPGPEWLGAADGPLVLNVIVPVYKDLAATQACLDALARQTPPFALHLVIVDDRSPDPGMSDLVGHFCAAQGAVHIVNPVNLGFAGSVNKAIGRCAPGDVLLLNSDVVLGEGVLERMACVAHRDTRIGTVMPFSNDSTVTSFPIPRRGSPFPTPAEQRAIDDAAWSVHGPDCVDLLTNIGFCLYIRKHCFLDVGLLNLDYDRGYYEDVEYCLKAAEKGYRNVAAVGIYVGHASGRSFQDHRSILVARNGSLLRKRFEALNLKEALASEADPLRDARAAIEEQLQPTPPVHLLVGRPALVGPVIDQRLRALSSSDCVILRLSWSGFGDRLVVKLEQLGGLGPKSLAFRMDRDGAARLTRYLSKLTIVQVELAELGTISAPVRASLASVRSPFVVLVDSRELAVETMTFYGPRDKTERGPSASPAPDLPSASIIPLDAMAQRFLTRARERAEPSMGRPGAGGQRARSKKRLRTVGFVVPLPRPSIDTLILRIARALDRTSAVELIVFGACVDELQVMSPGNVHVSGRIGADEYLQVVDQYGIDALFSPYRTSTYGVFATLAAATGLPKGYFDWSGVPTEPSPDDLVLDWDLPDDAVSSAFAKWCDPVAVPARVVRVG